jgi:hypothetical protein
MAIGTPTGLGSAYRTGAASAGQTTDVLTTGASSAAGSLIVVFVMILSNTLRTVASMTDSAGNTYSLARRTTDSTTCTVEIWYCANAAALAAGGTITATYSGATVGSNGNSIAAASITGCSATPVDVSTGQSASGSSSISVASGALAQDDEILIGHYYNPSGSSTESAGFSSVYANWGGGNTVGLIASYKSVRSKSSVTYAPSGAGVSGYNIGALASFKGLTFGPPPFHKATRFFKRRF